MAEKSGEPLSAPLFRKQISIITYSQYVVESFSRRGISPAFCVECFLALNVYRVYSFKH